MATPGMASITASEARTYNSVSGTDIQASFQGHWIGELQGISFTVTREKAPLYTMGSPNPRGFSRGKRGVAGLAQSGAWFSINPAYIGEAREGNTEEYLSHKVGHDELCRDYHNA